MSSQWVPRGGVYDIPKIGPILGATFLLKMVAKLGPNFGPFLTWFLDQVFDPSRPPNFPSGMGS